MFITCACAVKNLRPFFTSGDARVARVLKKQLYLKIVCVYRIIIFKNTWIASRLLNI